MRVLGFEPATVSMLAKALQGELTIEDGQHDAPVDGCLAAIDYGDITRKDARINHAVTSHAHGEGRVWVLNQQLVEVERPVQIIICRSRKARRCPAKHQRHQNASARECAYASAPFSQF
jgi:hypothetical protein